MEYDPERIAAFISLCNEALKTQSEAAKSWPNPLILPEPEDGHERKALDLFIDELESATGRKVELNLKHRH